MFNGRTLGDPICCEARTVPVAASIFSTSVGRAVVGQTEVYSVVSW